MKFFADLHVHSHFSRATSRALDPEHLALWGKKKGIALIGTGDFTHAGWVSELRDKLIEAEDGIYRLKPELEVMIDREIPASCRKPAGFLLTGEISCIYKRAGKTRKLHNLILMPDMSAVLRLNERLGRIGNLDSDGRPILGLDSRDLLEIVLDVSDRAFFIPAHVWTPWFSLFGSKSGFDSLEEAFGDLATHIHALETGLSSDPPMNRLLSAIDNYLLVSNSDAHSPSRLGRETNIFDTEMDYDQIVQAMITGHGFQGTIEFFPEEGKYHFDGHRKCQIRLHPRETKAYRGICPSCGKPLTVGVLHRVDELSDRKVPVLSKDFYSLIPLTEILSEILGCGPSTKRVSALYEDLLVTLGPELHILMDVPLRDIQGAGHSLLPEAINRMRRNQVIRLEGYDGEYGKIRLFEEAEKDALAGQTLLFRPPKRRSSERQSILRPGGVSPEKIRPVLDKEETCLSDPILDPLNPDQREAVLYRGGHLLIVAGPGTGKTMTLSHRVAYLIRSKQNSPEGLLALTFTHKAAREMGERIRTLLRDPSTVEIWVSTFHGFCLEVLGKEGKRLHLPSPFTVCSELDASILAQQIIAEAGRGKGMATKFRKELPRLKMASLIGDKREACHNPLLPHFKRYQERLRKIGMLDLDDLEVETLRLFQEHPGVCLAYAERFPRIFVDEYQDSNPVQVALLKIIIQAGSGEICAIGDPDQAIYGFRGAEVQNFHRFAEDFPGAKEIKLVRNYRSSQVILDGSSSLMEKESPLKGIIPKGDPIRFASCATHTEEAEMIVEQVEKLIGGTTYFSLDSGRVSSHEEGDDISFGDIAVLFRLNAQGNAFEEAFKRAGIPFVRSGEKPLISRFPVNVIWRFLQALHASDNNYHLKAYLELPEMKDLNGKDILGQCDTRGFVTDMIDRAVTLHEFDCSSEESAEALRRLKEIAGNFGGDLKACLDALSLDRGIDHVGLLGDRVALMSLHAAKGLEWPVVFITGCEEGLIPCTLFGNRDEEEEKRLLYVGMTRARSRLILSHASRRKINRRLLQMEPSPFLDLIPKEFCGPLERTGWKRKGKPHKQLGLF